MTNATATKALAYQLAYRYERDARLAYRLQVQTIEDAVWQLKATLHGELVARDTFVPVPTWLTSRMAETEQALRSTMAALLPDGVPFQIGTYKYQVEHDRQDLIEWSMGRINVPITDLLNHLEELLGGVED